MWKNKGALIMYVNFKSSYNKRAFIFFIFKMLKSTTEICLKSFLAKNLLINCFFQNSEMDLWSLSRIDHPGQL